ncbi:MAG: signal peptidase I [Lachnospiraceae bacterium]|nr:signal peptidase I [Lachnospiraceae bacterium]
MFGYIAVNELVSWLKTIAIAGIIAFIINTFILANRTVPSGSMENTVMTRDRLFGNRLAYMFSEPQRGDIIIFKYPGNVEINYIKRIIGLPGETVEIVDGITYINGEPLDEEDYIKDGVMTGNFGPYNVPEDSYFVMGDNRENSNDSRYWQETNYVHEDLIVAKAMFKYYPSIKILK